MLAWEPIKPRPAAKSRVVGANHGARKALVEPVRAPPVLPQWVGGGKVHTPRPRDYTQAMPQKMRQAAIRSALSVKAAENNVVVLESLELPEIKTRLMAQALGSAGGYTQAH